MSLRTPLTDLLGIEHPVMLAGMGGISYWELTAAVSEAGGYGCLGAATMYPDQLVREMAAVQSATDKPFGVDLLTALEGNLDVNVDNVIASGASLLVAGLGVPAPVIERCHQAGLKVASLCGKVRHATAAVEAGCDIVIAQGTEAGGHTGQVATLPLVPLMVDAVAGRALVVAAGGIFDGRGLAAALALGADGAWIGTRFIATPEAHAVGAYAPALVAAQEDDTVITRAYSGKTMRVLRNSWTEHYTEHPEEILPFPAQAFHAIEEGAWHLGRARDSAVDPAKEAFLAGQGVGGIRRVQPAAEIVHEIVEEAERVLARVGTLVDRRR